MYVHIHILVSSYNNDVFYHNTAIASYCTIQLASWLILIDGWKSLYVLKIITNFVLLGICT